MTWIVTEFDNIPPGTLDTMVKQNRDAIAWVYRNAKELRRQSRRIHVLGHSSGGHLSAMMQCTDCRNFTACPATC